MRVTALVGAIVLAALPGVSIGQEPAPQPSVELPPELARVLTDYETAWGKRDAAALSQLFAEDGFVLPGGRLPVRGRAAIQQYYTGHGGPLALRAFAFATEGRAGYILGGYAEKRGAPDDGKFTLTLRKDAGGRWLDLLGHGQLEPATPMSRKAGGPAREGLRGRASRGVARAGAGAGLPGGASPEARPVVESGAGDRPARVPGRPGWRCRFLASELALPRL